MIKLAKQPQLVRLRAKGESVCPISKTIDVFEAVVEYAPRGAAIELEEFKKIIDSYRGKEILQEELAVDLLEKIRAAVNPAYIKVTIKSTYMGIDIEAIAESGGVHTAYI
ncbi:MAG: GTP cyclohydrolase I [Thermoproteus sp. AZ2]|jgi:NADPH-dependent 7-cyano-7-deazaguanine reductase QueF|uniref:GTP cyclohydrolase I n=1 Tax=Thermoproteus sp. AZ2 TaxID=1609232 RepID=A0ACC6V1V8_9CREN|nr:MAG: GTP cyclohydrolase [Thermoproteus sp. AZ2]